MKNPEGKHRKAARRLLNKHGYRAGGHVTPKEAVHAHERHDHKGTPLTKLKRGGSAGGSRPAARADKPARARGGRTKAKTHIIIVNGGGGQAQQRPVPVPVPRPVPVPAGGPAGAPPMAAGPRPPMPGGMPPMQKRGGAARKRGGAAKGAEGKAWQKRIKGAGFREEREENEGRA